MRLVFCSLGFAIALGSAACSSGGKPPVVTKADATAMFLNGTTNIQIFSEEGGPPTQSSYGGTVSNGKGFAVSCQLSASGASYSILAHIESPDASLDIQSENVSAGVAMTFWKSGSTPEPVRSVNASNDTAPTCTANTSQANTLLKLEAGTIFASYDCPNVVSPSNTGTVFHVQGLFYFTGCSG